MDLLIQVTREKTKNHNQNSGIDINHIHQGSKMELKIKPTRMALKTIHSRSQNNDAKPYLASHNKHQRPHQALPLLCPLVLNTPLQCLGSTGSSSLPSLPLSSALGNIERSRYRRQSKPSPEQQCLHGKYPAKQSSQNKLHLRCWVNILASLALLALA